MKILRITLKSSSFNYETPRLIYEILHKINFIVEDSSVTKGIISSLIHQLEDNSLPIAQQLYSIRILGNFSTCPKSSDVLIETIEMDPESFLVTANALLQSEEEAVYSETIWFLGNIWKTSQDLDLSRRFIEEIVKRLIVPRKPQYEFQKYIQQQKEHEMEN